MTASIATRVNTFAILGPDAKARLASITALTARLNRALSGPYTTLESTEAAEWQARELADEASALSKALTQGEPK